MLNFQNNNPATETESDSENHSARTADRIFDLRHGPLRCYHENSRWRRCGVFFMVRRRQVGSTPAHLCALYENVQ